jgi:type I restriction enzyme S subunit
MESMVLKMRKMKDSGIEWIGEIPEGWEVLAHKYIMHKEKSICEHYSGEDVISLTLNGVVKRDLENPSGKMPTTFDSYQFVNPNDLLLCLFDIDVTPRCVGLVRDYGVTSPAYSRFKIHSGFCNAYYNYLLRFIDDEKVFVHLSKNLRSSLTESDFGVIKTIVPPKAEQQRIADYLDNRTFEIDTLLSKARSSIEEYKKLKQAVITQAVTKGVRGEREMKDSGVDYIGQIPSEWFFCKLRNVGDTQNGISKSSEFFGKGFPFVSYSDVYKNYSLPFAVSGLVESTPEEQERYSVKEGDIFFTRTSETIEEVGFSCVCEKDIPNATFAGFLIRVRPFSDKLHTPYAKYYFRSSHLRFYLVKEMNLITRASLGQSLLKSMPVLLPPLEEQKEIADYLDAKCAEIDGLIAKKEQLVKELESYKKSLIYEVVTGKREV